MLLDKVGEAEQRAHARDNTYRRDQRAEPFVAPALLHFQRLGLAPVSRTLALPEIAELRPVLSPELPVYASTFLNEVEQASAGIVDAIGWAPDGTPQVVIDWKSDVQTRTTKSKRVGACSTTSRWIT